ncbi:MAG: hypothetical protein RL375_2556 [Pseudomonadota bacterium]|jgi:uncharacterized protein YdaU (DUF1376 family)
MNYYSRHLGDYAKDTGHLTMIEHGAYGLLLDRYYGTEAGIPADQVHRVARARSKEEKDAVDAVLAEFFTLKAGVWINARCEEELTKARTKIEAAHENGRRGGRPRGEPKPNPGGNPPAGPARTDEKPSGFPLGSSDGTQAKALQSPITNNQGIQTQDPPASLLPPDCDRPLEPRLDPEDGQSGALPTSEAAAQADALPAQPKASKPRGSTKCPDDFAVTDAMRQWAAAEAPGVDVDRETAKLRDHTFAKARSDWPGTWRNWLRTAADALPRGRRNGRQPDRIDRQLETAGLMVGSAYGYPAAANPSTPPMEFTDVTARAIAA